MRVVRSSAVEPWAHARCLVLALFLAGCRDACAQPRIDAGAGDVPADEEREDRSVPSDVVDASRASDADADAAAPDAAATDAGGAFACPALDGGTSVYVQVFRSADGARLTPQSTPELLVEVEVEDRTIVLGPHDPCLAGSVPLAATAVVRASTQCYVTAPMSAW